MNNDSLRIQSLEASSMLNADHLSRAEYDTLRELAAEYLSYQTLAQCLAPKLPHKPGVSEAWEVLGDRIMCDEEEAEKRRELQLEIETRMRAGRIREERKKREQYEERKQAIASALGQYHKVQMQMDQLKESMADQIGRAHV